MSPTTQTRPRTSADWSKPPNEQEGLSLYARILRERISLVILAVIVCTGVAAAYVATAEKTYEAEAAVLLTPVPPEADLLITVGLTPGSADPARDIQTVARLAATIEVARLAQQALPEIPETQGSAQNLLTKISAEPVAESNLISITASAGSADNAAALANAFASSLIKQRTDELHARVKAQLELLRQRVELQPADSGLSQQISVLEGLLSAQDPTLQTATSAIPPTVQSSPRPVLSVAGGLLAGLVLGVGAAFAQQALDPRLRREDQLRRMFGLPILARIPKEGRRRSALNPRALSPAAIEAYRTLRATVSATTPGGGSILITGASPSDGKTTTAVSLAGSLAAAGKEVILIEADLRRPSIGRVLDVTPDAGVTNVVFKLTPLEQALVSTPDYGPRLRLLLADFQGDMISQIFDLPGATEMLNEARRLADYVIVDSPPLTDVVDALPLAKQVGKVLLVSRLGNTRFAKLAQLGELLTENGIRPMGIVLVGTPRPRRRDYSYYHQATRRIARPAPGSQEPPFNNS